MNDGHGGVRRLSVWFSLLVAVSLVVTVRALQRGPGNEPAPADSLKGVYAGPASCASSGCHGSPAAVEGDGILTNEYDTWLHAPSPTHVRAWDVLLQPLSDRIARNLRLADPPESAPECLGCHSTLVRQEQQLRPGVMEPSDGVSCEGCHGPAGGWLAGHVRSEWSRDDSTEAGMVDLANLEVRSRTCMRCHVGGPGLEVTHEYIAAGHPILVFELDNYTNSDLMPRHWRPDPATEGVEAWAIGQLLGFVLEVENLARHVKSSQWPEFSHMSCASCHHSLAEGEWRQQRGYEGRVGMPLWSPERIIVTRHLLELAAPDRAEEISRLTRLLSSEVGKITDEEAIESLSLKLLAELRAAKRTVRAHRFSDRDVVRLIGRIRDDASLYLVADRQSAEQATLSLISLVSELDRRRRGSLATTVDQLYELLDSFDHPDEYDRQRFSGLIGDLEV